MKRLGIYGAGNIGSSLATLCTGNGFETVIVGHSEAGLERCKKSIEKNWNDLIEKGLVSEKNKQAAFKLLSITRKPSDLKECTFIFEAVAENIGVKEKIYNCIENICTEDTIIASTTSSITANELSYYLTNKSRFLITHPFQPVHIQPLVEVVSAVGTSDETERRTVELLEKLGRQVVTLKKDIPGFIVNRLAQTMFRESLHLIEQGVATASDIDKAVKWAVGKRYANIGLLEYFDYVGFQLEKNIAENIYPTLCDTKTTQKIVEEGLRSGKTGYIAGIGLYNWEVADKENFRKRYTVPFLEDFNWKLPE